MGHYAVGSVCCVMHIKEPSALVEKRRGSPWCAWFDWLHIVPQHLVNLYTVLRKRSRVSLSDGYDCYVRSHYYYCYMFE